MIQELPSLRDIRQSIQCQVDVHSPTVPPEHGSSFLPPHVAPHASHPHTQLLTVELLVDSRAYHQHAPFKRRPYEGALAAAVGEERKCDLGAAGADLQTGDVSGTGAVQVRYRVLSDSSSGTCHFLA